MNRATSSLTKSRRCISDPKLYRRHLSGKNDYFARVETGVESLVVGHGQCFSWVKLRRTHCEQMSSGLPLIANIARCSRHFAFVPNSDSCSAAKKGHYSITSSARARSVGGIYG